jgi:hypothetical protein
VPQEVRYCPLGQVGQTAPKHNHIKSKTTIKQTPNAFGQQPAPEQICNEKTTK